MQSIKSFLSAMENEPQKMNNIPKFPLLLDKINVILSKIASCKNPEEAGDYFDLLERIHSLISKIMFIDKINIPNNFWKFFKDFDRIDTTSLRIHFFNELKSGNYVLPPILLGENDEIIFVYNAKSCLYTVENASTFQVLHLAHFLVEDVGYTKVKLWKDFIDDDSRIWKEANYSYILKENGKISLGKKDGMADPNAKTFSVTTGQLNYILDRWQEALEKKPNKIIITKDDNGEIKVEFED